MAQIGFYVRLNGAPLVTGGIDSGAQITTLILTSLQRVNEDAEPTSLSLSGMDLETGNRLRWVEEMVLGLGDCLEVRLVNGPFDAPGYNAPAQPEEEVLAQKVAYYHRLKAELEGKGLI